MEIKMKPGDSPSAVTVRQLTVVRDQNVILKDLSIAIPSGKLIAILGQNGVGKTTFLESLVRLVRPTTGEIHFVSKKSAVGYIPQKPSLNMEFPIRAFDFIAQDSNENLKAEGILAEFGLEEQRNQYLDELSGGQLQKVLVARSLVEDNAILILDEPFHAVDEATTLILLSALKKRTQSGMTILIALHDTQLVELFFDDVILIKEKQARISGVRNFSFGPKANRPADKIQLQPLVHD